MPPQTPRDMLGNLRLRVAIVRSTRGLTSSKESGGAVHPRCSGNTGTVQEPQEHSDALEHTGTQLAPGDVPSPRRMEDQSM